MASYSKLSKSLAEAGVVPDSHEGLDSGLDSSRSARGAETDAPEQAALSEKISILRNPDSLSGSAEPNDCGKLKGDNHQAKPHAQDLEALARIPSGPAYSVFTKRQKLWIVFMTAWASFFFPMSANIYFPALNTLSRDLKVSSGVINLTLTSYMIFQSLAPTIFGDLADMGGRRPAYFIGFVIYIGANIGLACQNNYVALLVLRCLQSTGSSGTVALGSGFVADIASSAERGSYMGGLLIAQSIAKTVEKFSDK